MHLRFLALRETCRALLGFLRVSCGFLWSLLSIPFRADFLLKTVDKIGIEGNRLHGKSKWRVGIKHWFVKGTPRRQSPPLTGHCLDAIKSLSERWVFARSGSPIVVFEEGYRRSLGNS